MALQCSPVYQVITPLLSHVTQVSDTRVSNLLQLQVGVTQCYSQSSHQIAIMRGSLILSLLSSSVLCVLGDVTSMTDKILKDILKDYNAQARPAGNVSDR